MKGYLVEVKIDGKLSESFIFTDSVSYNKKVSEILASTDKVVILTLEPFTYI